VSRLVVVVPLKDGARERAAKLLRGGPPFDLEETHFDRHHIFLTDREVVFVFEADEPGGTLRLSAEDPALWKAAMAWRECMAGGPRVGATAFTWVRTTETEGVYFEPTPGPGDSEGGDLYSP
jgi:hypothetical protein